MSETKTWKDGFIDGYKSVCGHGPSILIPMATLPLLGESSYDAGFREGAEAADEIEAVRPFKPRP